MPGIPQLIIEQSDGTVRDTLDCVNASKDKSLIDMWVGYAVVDRAAWLNVKPNVDERTDVFKIEESGGTLFWAGRYAEDSRDGDTVTLTIESFERDARDAEPTDSKLLLNSVADSTVATTYGIDAVPSLSQGIIETGDSSVSFSFAWAERAKVIRDAAEPAGMDVAFNPDQTVDFVNRLGADKSANITVSSTNQTIVDSLSVEDKSRDPVTHVRGLGAQQGGSQVTATATIASYTAGERQIWRKYENKDIINQDRLQSIVDRLASEFDSERRRITINATLVGVDVDLGDSITVDLPEDDISRTMRITRLKSVIDSANSVIATLTNRDPSRGGSRKRRDDLKRFNSGDEGFIDRDNFRAIERQPVDATYNAVGNYYYPDDVIREDRAEVVVQALPYRSYVSGGGHSHSVYISDSSTSDPVPSSQKISYYSNDGFDFLSPSSTTTMLDSYMLGSAEKGWPYWFEAIIGQDPADSNTIENIEVIINPGDGLNYRVIDTYDWAPFKSAAPQNGTTLSASQLEGNQVNMSVRIETSDAAEAGIVWGWSITAIPEHSHGISISDSDTSSSTAGFQPGLNEYANETASGVDLIVNGSTVASNIGTGSFTTVVDVSGEFTQGNNTIELTSDSLGFLTATARTELFRSGAP